MRCAVLNNLQKRRNINGVQQIDSPLQVQLIKFLGLKNYFIEKFIFKRKPPKYHMCIRNSIPVMLMPNIYQPDQKLKLTIKLLQTSNHSIPLVILTHKQPIDDYIIIYSHGNSSDLSSSINFIENIALNFNIDALAYDYSGYGQSRVSTIGQQTIVKDLEIIIKWLDRPINKIILWGFSLGSYPTVCNSALYNSIGAMVLIAPIASINCLFQDNVNVNSKFKEDHFSNFEMMDRVKCLTFITHSMGDQIIPIDHSRLLFEKYCMKNGKQKIWFLEISKLNHNSLHKYFTSKFNNELKDQFSSFLKLVRKTKKNVQQPFLRSKNRYLIIQSDLEQQKFYEEDFQLQAIGQEHQQNLPGRKFSERSKKKIFPNCFDYKF